jgi:hypothetical protein
VDEAQRKLILDAIRKNAEKGEFDLDPYMKRSGNFIDDSYRANNLQEQALGSAALEQFKGKIPNKGSSSAQMTDFAHELTNQFTPDVKKIIQIDPSMKDFGVFDPSRGKITLNPKGTTEDFASTVLHENLHARDFANKDYGDTDELLPGPKTNKKLKSLSTDLVDDMGRILDPKKMRELVKSADINDLKELLLKGHHGLKRGATVAQANLPRLLKGMPVLGVAAALLSQDASAAVPGLSEADDVGESAEEEKQLLAEDKARKSYNKSPAKMARLRKLMGQ